MTAVWDPQAGATQGWRRLPGVVEISWPDPESRNAVGGAVARRIASTLSSAASDPEVRVVLLGAGQAPFCSGWDMRDLAGLDTSSRADVENYFAAGRSLLRAIDACPVPVVAGVSGVALGFGCSLLARADLVLADERAVFGLPEVSRGFPPATVIPELLGAIDSRELAAWALTGHRYSAARASQAGLVHRTAPAGTLDELLGEVLGALSATAGEVLRTTKSLVRDLSTMPLEQRRASGVAAAVNHFCS